MPTPFLEKYRRNIMNELKEQITNTVNRVQDIVDLFYQQNDKIAFEKFESTLDDMTKAIDGLYLYKSGHMDFEMDEKNLCDILSSAMEALENGDSVLIADILQYDFIEYINELLEQME